jgi:subtilisin family serine protease
MKYVILRDPQRRSADSAGREISWRGHPPADSELPRIEVADVNAKERSDLARDPAVQGRMAALMPTRLIEPRDSSADNDDGDSWGIDAVRADASKFTGAGIRVAVLDTGIDRAHPAFADMDLVEEDFSGCGNGDTRGHGTHCAGTVFGRDVDGSRIGVARGVRQALIGKIIGDDGRGNSDAMCEGIRWAVDQGAQVISMSVGFDFPGMVTTLVAEDWPTDVATSFALEAYRDNLRLFDSLMATIRAMEPFGSGCVVVAAAGNESRRDIKPDYEIAASLPAAAEGVLSTGALSPSPDGYTIAWFSNTFPELCAPGTGIKSAYPGGGLHTMSGTSMACPHVAGVAALWWEAVRAMPVRANAAAVTARITAACRTEGLAPGMVPAVYGSGLVTAP